MCINNLPEYFPILSVFVRKRTVAPVVEGGMRTMRQGSEAGRSAMDETCPKHDTHADENPGANSLAMTGVPLPPPRPTRWVPHRKAEVMAAVRGGALSLNEALE